MNKLAAYELLLEDHPLWNKEAMAGMVKGVSTLKMTRPSYANRVRPVKKPNFVSGPIKIRTV